MSNIALQAIAAVAVIIYCIVTLMLVRKRPGHLWTCAAAVFAGGFVIFWKAYAYTGAWMPRLVMSILAALDLFVFRANTMGPVSGFFFGEGKLLNLVILYSLLLCAVWTTSLAAVHIFARKLESRVWLFFHTLGKGGNPVHLIVGLNPRSVALAASLEGKGRVVVLDDSVPAPGPKGKINFWGVLRGIRVDSPFMQALRKRAPHASVLKLSPNVRRLDRWLCSGNTNVYLLSEDDSVATALRMERRSQAGIWFSAREDELTRQLPISHPRLHLIDISALTAQSLKREEALYPVHFVEVGKDEGGRRAGYVTSGFSAAVLGSEAFTSGVRAFLTEWGAFVDRDYKAAPLNIDVAEDVDETALASLNWVGVCFEDDETSIRKALEIAERRFMAGKGSDRFVIAIRMDRPAVYAGSFQFAKENYGVEMVPFGQLDTIWTYDSITGGETARYAKAFYDGYTESAGGGVSWEEREDAILKSGHTPLWNALELKRKRGQDYSDYFHRKVKMQLCELFSPEYAGAFEDIPVQYVDAHYTGSDSYVGRTLEYLAIGEHLRWEASHLAAGYRLGAKKEEDRMIHTDLVPYENLSEVAKHYDWIVVRTSLRISSAKV